MATKEPNQSDLLLQYLQTARNARCSWGEVDETVRQQFADADIAALLAQHGNVARLEELYAEMGPAAVEPRKMQKRVEQGFAFAARRFEFESRILLSFHSTQAEAVQAMDASSDARNLSVVPATVRFASNGNVQIWQSLGEPVAERKLAENIPADQSRKLVPHDQQHLKNLELPEYQQGFCAAMQGWSSLHPINIRSNREKELYSGGYAVGLSTRKTMLSGMDILTLGDSRKAVPVIAGYGPEQFRAVWRDERAGRDYSSAEDAMQGMIISNRNLAALDSVAPRVTRKEDICSPRKANSSPSFDM